MSRNDQLDEVLEWKHQQEIKEAERVGEKAGRWKTCVVAWSIITGFTGVLATLCVQFSKPLYGGLKTFWVLLWQENP